MPAAAESRRPTPRSLHRLTLQVCARHHATTLAVPMLRRPGDTRDRSGMNGQVRRRADRGAPPSTVPNPRAPLPRGQCRAAPGRALRLAQLTLALCCRVHRGQPFSPGTAHRGMGADRISPRLR